MVFNLQEELKKLPDKPGVYIMHNKDDEIIYVGKAVILKNRVRQYFQSNKNHTPKVKKMVSNIAWFEYIVVDSEMEALVLECNLIKQHRPKYNTMLKDDKHYPYIKLTMNETYPRLLVGRERKSDGGRYFGPYTSAEAVSNTIDLLQKTYKIRHCKKNLKGQDIHERPCIYHSMGQCLAPCQGNITKEEYKENVDKCINFLNGNYAPITEELKTKMYEYSEQLEFEKAGEMRDLLQSVMKLDQAQKADECDNNDRDFVAVSSNGQSAVASCFFVREGKLTGREHFYFSNVENDSESDILENFIKQYYSGTPHIPKEIYLSADINARELYENWLTEIRGTRVQILIPKKGDKHKFIDMAYNNARIVLLNDENKIVNNRLRTVGAMAEIENLLGLSDLRRVESFDISHTQGFENVASMVVFEEGKPKKSDYRKFKTRTVVGADDYKSMKEVLTRRFQHGLRERELGNANGNDSFVRFPDLLLIDGGKGQVHAALEVLEELKLSIPVCGMVKDDRHRTRGLYFEDQEIEIDTHSEGFKLITRIQDETHRFAIEFHRSLRSKAQTRSILDDIPDIGHKRRLELMTHFGSLDNLLKADIEEIAAVPSMNDKAAESVWNFLHKKHE